MPYFWLPEDGLLDRDRKEGGHYRAWRDAGLLETTPGKAINFAAIIHRLAEISTKYDLVCVAYDRAFIKTFNVRCEEIGVRLPLKEYGQGFVVDEPGGATARGCRARQAHPSRWSSNFALANVATSRSRWIAAANRKPSKKRAIGHIDGVVSLLMALAIAAQPQPASRRGSYDRVRRKCPTGHTRPNGGCACGD